MRAMRWLRLLVGGLACLFVVSILLVPGISVAAEPATTTTLAAPEASTAPNLAQWLTAGAQALTAVAVVVGGIWGYHLYHRERPFQARANTTIEVELYVVDSGEDLLRVTVGIQGVGKGSVTFDKDATPFIAVYPFTREMVRLGLPTKWTHIVAILSVFKAKASVEAGETVRETHLLTLGQRPADVVAYRLEFGAGAKDQSGDVRTWRTVTTIPLT
jgi:hypothetical protein